MVYPPAIWHIELSEPLADSKIIAEAWDAAGLYQIGYFPGYRMVGVERALPRRCGVAMCAVTPVWSAISPRASPVALTSTSRTAITH